jgi:protein phosphatase 2C
MEEMSVAVPLIAGNSVCDNPTIATHMDVSAIKMMANAELISNAITTISADTTFIGSDEDHIGDNLDDEVGVSAVVPPLHGREGEILLLNMISQSSDELLVPEVDEDDSLSLEGDPIIYSTLSVTSENGSVCGDEFFSAEDNLYFRAKSSMDIDKNISSVEIVARAAVFDKSNVEADIMSEPLAVALSLGDETGVRSVPLPTTVLHQLPLKKGVSGTVGRSVFELDCTPLWGFTSLCGKRPEMEDAVAIAPRMLKIPIQMLNGNSKYDGMNKDFSEQTIHFFGVYDGHGGSQVKFYFIFRVWLDWLV